MFRIFNCLTTQHDWRLVVVAGVVCFLSSLTAITLFNRARETAKRTRAIWIAAAGAAAGCGIWATHFLAMLAYDPAVPVAYNIDLTVISLMAAAIVTGLGLTAAVLVPRRWGALMGGAIIGIGVACMHYLGMSALELPGHVAWELPYVIASIVVGVVLAMAALAVATQWKGRSGLSDFGAAPHACDRIASLHGHGRRRHRSRSHADSDPAIAVAGLARGCRCQHRGGDLGHESYQRIRRSPARRKGAPPHARDEQYVAGRRDVRLSRAPCRLQRTLFAHVRAVAGCRQTGRPSHRYCRSPLHDRKLAARSETILRRARGKHGLGQIRQLHNPVA